MDASRTAMWLGFDREGGRAEVRLKDFGKVLLLGQRAADISALVAFAAAEAGGRLTVLDIDGSLEERVSGYFRSFDYRSFLYEAFHIEGQDARHGQFVAAAYAAALDLTYEEEAILNSALQIIVSQDNMASPPVLFDALGKVEGFRGFYVDKLKGRMGALKLMDATHVEDFATLLEGDIFVSFARAPYPQAADLAAALFIAKIIALIAASDHGPDALIGTGAHRLFGSITRMLHGNRLMTYLLDVATPLALASDHPALLSEHLVESVPAKIYSSDAWNTAKDRRSPSVLPSSFFLHEQGMGAGAEFVPRHVPFRASKPATPAPTRGLNRDLARLILEEIERFDTATRESIVAFLSTEHLRLDIEGELDKLYASGYLIQEMKEEGPGPQIFAYTVTDAGKKLLRELRK